MYTDIQSLVVDGKRAWQWKNHPTKISKNLPKTKQKRADLVQELSRALNLWQEKLYAENKRKILLVLQGMDTSGKDGTIRSVFESVNPLGVRVQAFAAPSQLELSRDYLWRVHQVVPKKGELVVFNRSHYEDVLVTKVKGWITDEEEQQRLQHINDFEKMLTETGTHIIKIFLNISKEEQRVRLQKRLDDPNKHWKFSPSDVEDRQLWEVFHSQYAKVLSKTSTRHAPWYVVPADSKSRRNVMVLEILLHHLQNINPQYPVVDASDFPEIIK